MQNYILITFLNPLLISAKAVIILPLYILLQISLENMIIYFEYSSDHIGYETAVR